MPRFCQHCGSPVVSPSRLEVGRPRVVCPECGAEAEPSPRAVVAALITRSAHGASEVLLVRRSVTARVGAGQYSLVGGPVGWGESAREALSRWVWRQTGLEVEVGAVCEVDSSSAAGQDGVVGIWFHARRKTDQDPVAGADAEDAEWFPLDRLPSLAFPTEALILKRLESAQLERTDRSHAELEGQINRQRQKYRELLDAYTQELMRGAWINELHLGLSDPESPVAISSLAAQHLSGRQEIDEVRIWFPGPPDRCEGCPWSDRCPRERCLHLQALSRDASSAEGTPTPDASRTEPRDERIPLLPGTPAADVSLRQSPVRAELPGAGALPVRFEGFPLDLGSDASGVVGLYSRVPIDANARHHFEVVVRHVGTLIRNARLVEDLRAANNVKRSFIARLSHELKTPLTAILGFAELLREELEAEGNEMGAEGASTIEDAGRKLLDKIESILEIAKLESGAARLRPQRVNLAQLLRERQPTWKDAADQKNLAFQLDLPDGPEALTTAWVDPRRAQQVFEQLLSNAFKFTHEGRVHVTLEADPDFVTCRVDDTGIGVAPEHREVIFDAFHQVSEAIHIEYGGLGIGLSMAKVLIELLGGRIWLEPKSSPGSCFTFTFPRSAQAV